MDELRLGLLFMGVLVIAGVYLGSRYAGWFGKSERTDVLRRAPTFETEVEADHSAPVPDVVAAADSYSETDAVTVPDARGVDATADIPAVSEPDSVIEAPESPLPAGIKPMVVVITVLVRDGERVACDELVQALEAVGMHHGDMRIFHYVPPGGQRPLFSAADVLEPGHFDLDQLAGRTTRGVSLFMQLPGPMEGNAAYDTLVAAARHLAERLHGDVHDETRSVLTPQTVAHTHERIKSYQFSLQMAQRG